MVALFFCLFWAIFLFITLLLGSLMASWYSLIEMIHCWFSNILSSLPAWSNKKRRARRKKNISHEGEKLLQLEFIRVWACYLSYYVCNVYAIKAIKRYYNFLGNEERKEQKYFQYKHDLFKYQTFHLSLFCIVLLWKNNVVVVMLDFSFIHFLFVNFSSSMWSCLSFFFLCVYLRQIQTTQIQSKRSNNNKRRRSREKWKNHNEIATKFILDMVKRNRSALNGKKVEEISTKIRSQC